MDTRDLLLEIGTEEIPAKFMPPALAQLRELAEKGLQEARLGFGAIETYGTPRRLTLYVTEVTPQQQDLRLEVKGPAVKAGFDKEGNPTKAAQGFARSQGVDVSALVTRDVAGVPYLYALRTESGRPAEEVLPQLLKSWIGSLSFPKPMRWAWGETRFARPIRWIVALYGAEIVPIEIEGVQAGRITYGHRFLSGGPLVLNEPSEYLERMEAAYVIADPQKRKDLIWKQITELAAAEGGLVAEDEGLLNEITYLVEYPTALCGQVNADYMHLPEDVLITPMKEHQRYFPVKKPSGGLLPKFITVRNGTAEHIAVVRAGNEKVLRARLADAAFFYAEDQKTPLSAQREKLKKIVFQESLGTVYERVEREQALTGFLADNLKVSSELRDRALRAAELAKADLVTHMVYEFPELQGIMGERYALLSGEAPQVAQAIREHYQPRFSGDDVPASTEGTLVALADKMDAIVGCFSIGIIPTGSQDPYALRRQAQGVCQIIMRGDLPLSLSAVIEKAYSLYAAAGRPTRSLEETQKDLGEFFRQRLRHLLGEEGVRYDTIDAVLAEGFDQPAEALKRAKALSTFRQADAFAALITAYTRAANLAKKGGHGAIRADLFEEATEGGLYRALQAAQAKVRQAGGDYGAVLEAVAALRPAVDAFFDAVMVMAEDVAIRENRLALLNGVIGLTRGVADLSKLVD
ncbi:glycine--tRNA ligase subunit beta [Heliobacterium gestii]|uniref:Glycine--tRNA ligase beta subunit n=1 Tax=Heliomicrobium gestii TaxID=2699 RepID=A0A845LLJ5_HELGE|nr:glycine--tRNA ligase subunit beta [Heliomicrobium gestii]MBM7867987.1 glycyl-tRNA synthetase beta chain [Heliomicrobium gestii]MZP44253.1 glycine--tRNA ligase subunit beta [Heliomicrobium gestii]